VGAGVYGASSALELARRGHDVTLLDPGPLPHPDAASTDISKIVRADYGDDAFYTELAELSIEGWRRWNQSWPEPLFHETGFVILSSRALSETGFEGNSYRLLSQRGHRLERLDAASIAERCPRFDASRFCEGYLNPVGGWAESGRVVARLIEEAQRAGVRLQEGAALADVRARTADITIVCAGAWTHTLLPELADRIRSIGQPVLHFLPDHPERFAPPDFLPWAADIQATGWYGFPANREGVVKIANHGPGTPVDSCDRAARVVSPEAEPMFRDFLARTIPELADARLVGSRLCLYSDSFDGDFLIARHPDDETLVVAAGGSGHAFKFAPLLGPLIADVALGEPNRFASRFRWRARAERRTEQARFDG
jgi:glycine/D-amino acid oxidase-like deaminating enzyme